MWKKIFILALVGLVSSGCRKSQSVLITENVLVEKTVKKLQTNKADEALKHFFKAYFKLSQEELIKTNQKVNRKKQFDSPRMVQVTNGVALEAVEVEDVNIEGVESIGEYTIYHISVISKNKMMTQEDFQNYYIWDVVADYYVVNPNKQKSMPKVDVVRIQRKYWVQVNLRGKFEIKSVKEANPIQIDEAYSKKIGWNQNVVLLPYREEISKKERVLVEERLKVLLGDLKVSDVGPYKDDIVKVEWNLEKMTVEGVPNSSKLCQWFKINVLAKVLLNNNEVIYYNYNYLVELSESKVKKIQFIGIDKNLK